ncbi:MAG: pilus assembly protein PilO [Candidatus Dactylopiibacterium carminicum]|uniref:Pilus assembly protein PilO n=1 Tax=Candidatus Dactylopiibacterium carminicum TaxID=857335 RepID=A0A272EQL7_9RHOO|nr:type 4a pilus biogenesis protein PilO [Candidatus Dactylopiibacterium carminicum]KAF7598603.1 pilus assembly protein PilO [Candidatus Dactylopiibacterium carminicum]PAS92356.1 MAG: pilus assembly protein PilO [Candidatus Dactylopiibacterium carminicum]PAS95802.1 MAG: pilus assembly protein PilO [Candidatus Dactylopiibacterium carminicum]PAS98369.1 MAG: pilus assembly protein PilO [Candidatus Dactylopiibacterium carminicum]
MSLDKFLNDFRQLDPNDPGMWPLAPRIAALILLLILVVAGGWWFDWKGKMDELERVRLEEVKLKDEWRGKKQQAVNLDEYRNQLAEMDRQFGALLKQLPNKAEMESLLIYVNQAGRGRGLQFELWRPGSESVKEFYAELPITISISGGYHDFGQFVNDVAKLPRIVTLRNVDLAPGKDGVMRMNATAVTYRYLDDEEVAQQRRDKAAAAKRKK